MSEHKEPAVALDEISTLHIADDVVISIAGITAAEVDGVSSLSGAQNADTLTKKTCCRGVKLNAEGGTVNLDISILACYGHPIKALAEQVQERVKNAVETMTGLRVSGVNVFVLGVTFEKEAKKNR
ncbi:MAG: Asp23/Gls24 family envelope stress response protein [Oscillospiraceae bacterium]|jgi:uncharacterized alkaline shock family protein YloU|nr:Asp23/Gls24 family envelope stress response protein [Oscillospiraceae bacterium]